MTPFGVSMRSGATAVTLNRDLRLRRDVAAQLRAGGLALQAPGQRRVRAEERVRQHDGIRRHRIDLRLRRALHRDDVRRLAAVERRLQRDVLAADDAVDQQRLRPPLQVVDRPRRRAW